MSSQKNNVKQKIIKKECWLQDLSSQREKKWHTTTLRRSWRNTCSSPNIYKSTHEGRKDWKKNKSKWAHHWTVLVFVCMIALKFFFDENYLVVRWIYTPGRPSTTRHAHSPCCQPNRRQRPWPIRGPASEARSYVSQNNLYFSETTTNQGFEPWPWQLNGQMQTTGLLLYFCLKL